MASPQGDCDFSQARFHLASKTSVAKVASPQGDCDESYRDYSKNIIN
ncbi:hypothetical protein TCCBUS3UF1_11300 [Thermus sp. CCB_US3_UF1]|nr:hypothetical protein TCCBUS3UF1_11300 [Thermus sp. CCB_US3_UF1]